jgi:hypothetical protein
MPSKRKTRDPDLSDDDSVGSLEDFIVDDDQVEDLPEPQPEDNEEKLDFINPTNIVIGKRVRKPTQRYVDPDYWKLMTNDMTKEEKRQFEKEMVEEDIKKRKRKAAQDLEEEEDYEEDEDEVETQLAPGTVPTEEDEEEEEEEEEEEVGKSL